MTDFGLVCDSHPGGIVEPLELEPFTIVRLTAHPDSLGRAGRVQSELLQYAFMLHQARMKIALVFVRESAPDSSRSGRRALMRQYLTAVQPDYLVVGNEMDVDMRRAPEDRVSSWGMTPARYLPLWSDGWNACRDTVTTPVMGGLTGQTPGWLDRFLSRLHAAVPNQIPSHLCLNLYGDSPDTLAATIQGWRAHIPNIVVGEWNLPEPVAIEGAGNYTRYVRELRRLGVEWATYFCARNTMVDGLGFYDYPWVVREVLEGVG